MQPTFGERVVSSSEGRRAGLLLVLGDSHDSFLG